MLEPFMNLLTSILTWYNNKEKELKEDEQKGSEGKTEGEKAKAAARLAKRAKVRKVTKAALTAAVIIGLPMAGIHFEYRHGLTEKLGKSGLFYTDDYDKKEELKKITDFISKAKPAISDWILYHSQPTIGEHAKEAQEVAESVSHLFKDIKVDRLPITWKMYAYYYYAYLQMILADIDKSKESLEHAIESLEKIDKLDKEPMRAEERNWLVDNKITANLKIITAQTYAIKLRHARQGDSKSEIGDALKLAKEKFEFIGAVKGESEQVESDRLLGEIYEIIQMEKSTMIAEDESKAKSAPKKKGI